MFELITNVWYGKQYYFLQKNDIVYSRVNAVEVTNTEEFFDCAFEGRVFCISGVDEIGKYVTRNIEIVFDKNADFEYFTSDSCTHDGTYYFVMECMYNCAKNVVTGSTYSTSKKEPFDGCKIKYTIGNFVVLNEFDDKFRTDEKPWLQERTTVLLPLKYEVLNDE